ncbi:hypothetical protein KP509_14G073500 [Ceratopteris richardii]|uniref:LysM domain-containing protein n=1 Tax=Ceratopteris richardii TaxID=49495 RepID=A0A8T2TEC2_CERRI|nr:hypothetical protein KP509_14G073500 [Ceratopteris richardii]
MWKASDNEFNRTALLQSLQFWRGEPNHSTPQPLTSPSSHESPPLPASTSGPAITEGKKQNMAPDSSPQPWRYVRWRKAHSRLPQTAKEPSELIRGNFYHRVLPDEDLLEVAEKFATYPEVLMEANQIFNPVNIATGQLLWVPRTHPVEWGDTLWSLSLKYKVPIGTIQKANGIVDPDLIYAGDVLVVPEEPDNRNAW